MSDGSSLPRQDAHGETEVFALIAGAGFAGLGMAIALEKAGIREYVVLEKADSVGGTWRENTYPGCACDVPSHLYSYSFAPNPNWSSTYSTQPEIRRYTEECVARFGIGPRIRFGRTVSGATFDEATGTWLVTTEQGDRYRARIFVPALGPLHRFTFPAIPGLETFRGKIMHSAAWQEGYDGSGERIATIGTGASAIQFIPALAKKAARMHVFQRTPAWVLPRIEHDYHPVEHAAFEKVPGARFLYRQGLYWTHEFRALAFTYHPKLLAAVEKLAVMHLERGVKDPAKRRALRPDYRMGCKRILMSNTYYPALGQENVDLVRGGVREIRPNGIVGEDGVLREVDTIVFGTGFDVHDYLGRLSIRGRDGADLADRWRESAEAYLGTTVNGFPNLYFLVGPNTGLGHNSMIFMIESQVAHVMKHVARLREGGARTIEVKAAVVDDYNRDLQEQLRGTVWDSGCSSWYLDTNGRNATLWPGFTFVFRRRAARFDEREFEIREGAPVAAPTRVRA